MDPMSHRLARHMTVLFFSELEGNTSVLLQETLGTPTALMTRQGFEIHGNLMVAKCPITLRAVTDIKRSKTSHIFTKKDFPYRDLFDREYLVLLKHGFLKHLHTMSYQKHEDHRQEKLEQCTPKQFTPKFTGKKAIAWRNMSFLYWFLAGSFLILSCCLFAERIIDAHSVYGQCIGLWFQVSSFAVNG
ncbi:hypothetical protein BV898_05962 [Hypsibius exemplaris]|uniref:Uncharacterized protein n=1 Tax=Hypsibius exemplaris TaxID=2072580 RepID=A0A1W0WXN1_HYPEX|nr:hypothetical protein BV898_05962 [Hypsibius exemplaris]